MAALCLAIKVHGEVDSSSPETEASIMTVILRLGRGQFSSEELKMMEKSALKRLQWLLHPPTPQVFISFFVELFCAGDNIELKDTAIYLVELSVHDYYFVPLKPSVVALAALSTASSILGLSESWLTGVREDLLLRNGYEEPASIDACSARLEILYASCGTQANDDYVDHADEIIGNHSPRSVMN
ncbi:unnamed protein product [Pseudo-nitzschia multistriata]|uniref:Cyclin C-terminal domain-containing protein n=1 Tax=Pseudo-nitzschia multistriata TaxID=183589 RepID=A0A448Z355_9STRA|nr:unnamed protein product [Pseudo-nitzschia multistriata]